jgi:uncharacterized membrane protein (Fun14 family)
MMAMIAMMTIAITMVAMMGAMTVTMMAVTTMTMMGVMTIVMMAMMMLAVFITYQLLWLKEPAIAGLPRCRSYL